MNREIPPPPQAVIDAVVPILRRALAEAGARDEESEEANGGNERSSDRAVPEHVPTKYAVMAPQGDTAVLLIRGAAVKVAFADEVLVEINRADARALSEALFEFAEG